MHIETFDLPAFRSDGNAKLEAFKLFAKLIACKDDSELDQCALGKECDNRYSLFTNPVFRKRRDTGNDEKMIETDITVKCRVSKPH